MYALTLVNKCLYGIPDQDTFYDQTDYMEELNMTSIIENLINLDTAEGMDSTLMQQVQLYNVALKQEDGEPGISFYISVKNFEKIPKYSNYLMKKNFIW